MAKLSIVAGATSQSVNIFIQNSSSTTGAGLTGLVFNSGSLIAYYTFAGTATTAVAITLATLAAVNSAFSSGGFKEIDSVHMPGVYRLDIPNAALASGNGRSVLIMLSGATNMAPCLLEIELTGVDNQDSVHFGITGIPNAAAGANGGLPLSVDTSGRVDVLKINGTSQTARDIGASVLLSAGTGTGQLDFTSGVVKANLAQILGTALTETAGQIAAGFKKFFNIATPASTMDALTLVATATNLTNAPTAGDFTAAMKTSLNAATPASVTGAVGSVTGAVGSVTGNVGGSVASVTADVGITQAAADKVFGSSGATLAELAQAQPPTNPRPDQALMLLYMAIRNALTTTASSKTISNNAGTVICKQTLSDDGTTYTQQKLVTGP